MRSFIKVFFLTFISALVLTYVLKTQGTVLAQETQNTPTPTPTSSPSPLPEPTQMPQPTPQPTSIAQIPSCPMAGEVGTQLICNGQIWAYDECIVIEFFPDGSPSVVRCHFSQNPSCKGDFICPNPQPILQTPIPHQIVQVPIPLRASIVPVTQTNNQTTSQTVTVNVPAPGTTQIVREVTIVREQPIAIQYAQVLCPDGTSKQIIGSQIMCVVGTEGVTTYGNVGVGTTVVYSQVALKELPKTGLPMVAWLALALLPIGFRLGKFGKVHKDLANKPEFIWEERESLKVTGQNPDNLFFE